VQAALVPELAAMLLGNGSALSELWANPAHRHAATCRLAALQSRLVASPALFSVRTVHAASCVTVVHPSA
jgi:hypothetical protein